VGWDEDTRITGEASEGRRESDCRVLNRSNICRDGEKTNTGPAAWGGGPCSRALYFLGFWGGVVLLAAWEIMTISGSSQGWFSANTFEEGNQQLPPSDVKTGSPGGDWQRWLSVKDAAHENRRVDTTNRSTAAPGVHNRSNILPERVGCLMLRRREDACGVFGIGLSLRSGEPGQPHISSHTQTLKVGNDAPSASMMAKFDSLEHAVRSALAVNRRIHTRAHLCYKESLTPPSTFFLPMPTDNRRRLLWNRWEATSQFPG